MRRITARNRQRNARGSLLMLLAGMAFTALLLLGRQALFGVPLADGSAAAPHDVFQPWMLAVLFLPLMIYLIYRQVAALLRARTALEQQRRQLHQQALLLNNQLAQAQQAREFVGHFLHELGGLAIGAKGILAVLPPAGSAPKTPLLPDQRQLADAAGHEPGLADALKETVDEMHLLLDDLAILLRQGSMPALQRQRLVVATLLQQVKQLAMSAQPAIEVRVEVVPPDLVVSGDPSLLRRALLTAVRNAEQAIMSEPFCSERPWITLRGSLANGRVVLRVEDSGPGFSPMLLHKMRALVTRPAGTLPSGWFTDKAGGSGRGLPLLDQVARLHKGTFSFGNHADQPGAWVQLELPGVDLPHSWLPAGCGVAARPALPVLQNAPYSAHKERSADDMPGLNAVSQMA